MPVRAAREVASAAPVTPIFRGTMKTQSSTAFIAPLMTAITVPSQAFPAVTHRD